MWNKSDVCFYCSDFESLFNLSVMNLILLYEYTVKRVELRFLFPDVKTRWCDVVFESRLTAWM